MGRLSKVWLGAAGLLLGAFFVAALILPQSFKLTAFCDIAETLLLISGLISIVRLSLHTRARMRWFWSLIALGISFWLSYQTLWTYYEIILRREVPDIFAGDVILFLNIVPLMAALALRPHVPRDEYSARLGQLDFALLLIWWLYLYVLIVIPWQYVQPDTAAYNRDLNAVYLGEKVAFLVGLAACWYGCKGSWRKVYASLFGMSFCYSSSSALANWAIARGAYYSGSFYDIPLALAMAWLTWIGLGTKTEAPREGREVSTVYGVWVARCSMIAVFSLPLFAAWALSDHEISSQIREFRLGVTLLAALGMGTLVFLRQSLLERELIRLLDHSHGSVENLERLQAQILQSEKLASIGQLVGGAAHELNNPITAMLGYSDLLLSTQLTVDQESLAAKIGQQVRRTKSLVASLISFARKGPSPRSAIDLNTLARTALKLNEPQLQALKVEVRTSFDARLPKVMGDSNQILQVCLQLLGNCQHVVGEQGGGILTVSTTREPGTSVLQMQIAPVKSSHPAENANSASPENDLALSACRGILQEHQGTLTRTSADGSTELRVEMPSWGLAPSSITPVIPELKQSQPFA